MSDEFVILLDQPEAAPTENRESQEEFVILLDGSDGHESNNAGFNEDLTIECAELFKEHLLSELALGKAVSINLETLTHVDTTAIQLLTAAALKASSNGLGFCLEKPSQSFRDAVALLGYGSSLEGHYSQ